MRMVWLKARLGEPRTMLMEQGCCQEKTYSGLQPENCKRLINGDDRGSVYFAQSLIQLIEVQGEKLGSFLVQKASPMPLSLLFSGSFHQYST